MSHSSVKACLRFCVLFLFATPIFSQTILREYWLGIPGNTIADLTNNPAFPYFPTGRDTPNIFEGPTNWDDNYGARYRGYVRPNTTGNYTFFIAGDDQCELWLSTDENPDRRRLIARVLTWTGPRIWQENRDGNAAAQRSAPILLTAGLRYYIEALQKEDATNDCLAVGWQLPSGVTERPLPTSRIAPFLLSTNPPSITLEPADLTIVEGQEARFTVVAAGMEPFSYQWERDWVVLPVEQSGSLIFTARREDTGSRYRCVITNPKGDIISRQALLTVNAETTRPAIAVMAPEPLTTVQALSQIEITFTEPVQGLHASDLLINNIPATNVTGSAAGPYIFRFPSAPTGTATISFAANHGITDVSENQNGFVFSPLQITVDPNLPAPKIRINEIAASNESGLADEDGEAQDWIEIQNFGTNTVNLKGWSLTDDSDNPSQWIFPSFTITPGQRILVFASGKDRRATPLHTNFLLGEDGEFLGLFDASSPRNRISALDPYPEQRVNHSYGLDPNGEWKYYAVPSPSTVNPASPILGILPPPHFSSERGFYASPFEVHLTTEVPGAEIRFTTNGGDPSGAAGIRYTNRLLISATTTLRASVWKTNYLPSFPQTHTYLYSILPTIRSLPALSIVTATNNLLGPTGIIGINGNTYIGGVWTQANAGEYHNPSKHGIAWERPTSVEYFSPSNNIQFQADCGIRVQGSDYMRPRYTPSSKFSYRLYFRGDYGPGRLEFPLLEEGVPEYDQIVLRAGHNDMSNPFLKDEFMRRIFLATGQLGVRGHFSTLYLNGSYKGYYNPTERVEEHFLRDWHGGDEEWDVIEQNNVALDGDMANFNAMMTFFRTHPMTNSNNYLEGARRLDYVNFIDYLIANIYGANGDWPQNNWRAARERTPNGIWRFYMWDAEFAFGTTGRTPTYDSFAGELARNEEIPTIYKMLYVNPEFKLLFADRVNRHFYNNGPLTETNLLKIYAPLRDQLSTIIGGFNNAIQTTWIPQRRTTLTNHFRSYQLAGAVGAPVFNQHGGRVAAGFQLNITTTALNGSIYYTTNGIDPRVLFTGFVSPVARRFTNGQPLTLNESTLIKARVLNGTNWTALAEALFEVSEFGAPIRFTEINYNPPGGDAYEFIELKNFSAASIDLSGMSFNGISYRFPENSRLLPGATVVLASTANPAAFATRYPNVPVSGYFENSLSNGGERLTLLDRSENIVTWIDYGDNDGWPAEADGGGYTIELVSREIDPNSPAAWRKSPHLYGDPGAHEVPATPAVILSEIFSGGGSAGWIELQNMTGADINLTNYSLGDTVSPRRYVFQNLTLPANGFVTANFDVPATGSTLFLYDAQTNRLDAITFGALPVGFTLARINGAWNLADLTPNQNNVAVQLASAASVVFNEWLANPLPGADDWLELHNISSNYAAVQGLTLNVSNALYRIPSLAFIPPGGFLQLFASEEAGPNQLALKLPAIGAQIRLYDPDGALLSTVIYTNQIENVSEGRYPDASANIAKFRGSLSPGSSNYVLNAISPLVINELMARNVRAVINPYGEASDWIELYNTGTTNIPLTGFTLSDNREEPHQWTFQPGASIAARQYVVIWFDKTHGPTPNNTVRALSGEGGGVYLFNAQEQVIDQVEFGMQAPNLSIGRISSTWVLLNTPTPGATNSPAAQVGSSVGVRINEWTADWIELHNPATQPVGLAGMTLTDDLSLLGQRKYIFAPLSYLGARGFATWLTSGETVTQPGEVSFRLSSVGESIRLYSPALTALDTMSFASIPENLSQARIPNLTGAPTATVPTPSQSNYRLIPGLVINRIHPSSNRVEIRNLTAAPIDLGGWTISDDPLASKQTLQGSLPGFASIMIAPSFTLESAFGGTFVLARNSTNQARLEFGPGPARALQTSLGLQSVPDEPAQVVIHEIMFHPSDNDVNSEYIELRNISGTTQSISKWRVNGGVQFNFPTNYSLPTNGVIVIVPFDPITNTAAAAAFNTRYPTAAGATVLGPYRGKLNNAGDTISLERPLAPVAQGFIPHIAVDQITYTDQIPWPVTAGGGGAALHRIRGADFGNEPLNWIAGVPTPGSAAEIHPPIDRDSDTISDIWEIAHGLDSYNPADAEGDIDADGISNRLEFQWGSDPIDPSNMIRLHLSQAAGAPILQFALPAGRTALFESRDAFDLPWAINSMHGPFSENRFLEIPFLADGLNQRFYRVFVQ